MAASVGNSLATMASVEYWDEMYSDRPRTYDTLYSFQDIKAGLVPFFATKGAWKERRSSCRVLHIGCGTSDVTLGLWKEGFHQIWNIDFSEVVIDVMAQRWEELAMRAEDRGDLDGAQSMRRKVQWSHGDVTNLHSFASGFFDVVIEKFTLDAVLCEAKDELVDSRACAAMRELHRILAPKGALLSIAWGGEQRAALLRSTFVVDQQRLPSDAKQPPFLYTCRKRRALATPAAAETKSTVTSNGNATNCTDESAAEHAVVSTSADGMAEIWIACGPLGASGIEIDICATEVRWRQSAKLNGGISAPWQNVHFVGAVDATAAVARETRKMPPMVDSNLTNSKAAPGAWSCSVRIKAPLFDI